MGAPCGNNDNVLGETADSSLLFFFLLLVILFSNCGLFEDGDSLLFFFLLLVFIFTEFCDFGGGCGC